MGLDLGGIINKLTGETPAVNSGSMVVNLSKGERVSLTKGNPNLDKIHIGLGWDVSSSVSEDFDLDASVYMLGANGKVSKQLNFVFFNNLTSPCGSVLHTGDNLTGSGDGDDEVIKVQLSKIPADVDKIVFTVTIYDAKNRRQNFGQVSNAYIRILDDSTDRVLLKYDLSEDYSSACSLVVGEIYRHGSEWKFNATGNGTQGEIDEICRMFGVM